VLQNGNAIRWARLPFLRWHALETLGSRKFQANCWDASWFTGCKSWASTSLRNASVWQGAAFADLVVT